jgi:hypothetical protein
MMLMKAGFATQNITPRAGVLMDGFGKKTPALYVHDDLFLRVLYICQGDTVQAIVSYDLLFMERFRVDRIKGAIGNATGLCPSEILVNFTHTHAGPAVSNWAYAGQPEGVYLDLIEARTVEAVLAAREKCVDVSIDAGLTYTDLPINRRQPDEAGIAQWQVNPDGPVIKDLPFCIFREVQSRRVVGLLFSVACHPSMMFETAISAEFPGAAVRQLNEHYETEGAIFLQGAAGDAKPRPAANGDYWGRSTWEQMEEVGADLTRLVVEAEKSAVRLSPSLHAALVDVPWRLLPPPSREELEGVLASESETPPRQAWARDMLAIQEWSGELPREAGVLLHVIHLSEDLRIVAVEGEVLALLGRRILDLMPPGLTFMLGYSNGTSLYLPDPADLPFGGYEVDSFWEYHKASSSAPDCHEPLVEAVSSVLRRGAAVNT